MHTGNLGIADQAGGTVIILYLTYLGFTVSNLLHQFPVRSTLNVHNTVGFVIETIRLIGMHHHSLLAVDQKCIAVFFNLRIVDHINQSIYKHILAQNTHKFSVQNHSLGYGNYGQSGISIHIGSGIKQLSCGGRFHEPFAIVNKIHGSIRDIIRSTYHDIVQIREIDVI